MKTLTTEEIDHLAEIEAEATPWPWSYDEQNAWIVHNESDSIVVEVTHDNIDDVPLVMALRNAAPALLEAARAALIMMDTACLDGCDSIAHEEECPEANIAARWNELKADNAKLREQTLDYEQTLVKNKILMEFYEHKKCDHRAYDHACMSCDIALVLGKS